MERLSLCRHINLLTNRYIHNVIENDIVEMMHLLICIMFKDGIVNCGRLYVITIVFDEICKKYKSHGSRLWKMLYIFIFMKRKKCFQIT